MRRDAVAGGLLVAGAIGFVVTMSIHPTGGTLEKILREAPLIITAHALAIASVWLQAAGYLRFSRELQRRRPIADAGLAAFALAAFTAILAATINGLLTPALAQNAHDARPEDLRAWQVVLTSNFRFNAALAQIFVAAAAVATLAWSAAMFGFGARWTALSIAGGILAAGPLLALFTGHLQNNVHDVGLAVFAQSLWTASLGVLLCTAPRGADA